MRVSIFGAGGVGGYFGGRLAQAGRDVVFIARDRHLEALQQHGLQVESLKGDFSVQPVQATDDPRRVGPVDMILLAVKAWQVPEAAKALQPMIGEHTGVIWLGNGIEAIDQLLSVLGEKHVLGGLTRISVSISAPGRIQHVGIEPYIAFGELDDRPSERVDTLRQAFEGTQGVTVAVPADIRRAMWEKFIFIASISGVGAVVRQPVGVLRSILETRRLLETAIAEVTAVGRACGAQLPDDQPRRTMASIDGMGPAVMASMQRDIMEGRPSELEAQNGAVVRLGRSTGVPTPVHEFLYAALLPQEQKARSAAG